MIFQRSFVLVTALGLGLGPASSASGEITRFANRAEWEAAVGPFTTIDFTGFPHGTVVTEQYANLGVHFTDANDTIFYNPSSFYNDDYGLDGNGDITVVFDQPIYWIGVDYPGIMQYELYYGGQLIHLSDPFGGGGSGFFAGLLSTEPFDAAVLIDPAGEAEIDDLHFGPPIPAPPVIALLALAACAAPRRRRC